MVEFDGQCLSSIITICSDSGSNSTLLRTKLDYMGVWNGYIAIGASIGLNTVYICNYDQLINKYHY